MPDDLDEHYEVSESTRDDEIWGFGWFTLAGFTLKDGHGFFELYISTEDVIIDGTLTNEKSRFRVNGAA